MKDQSGTQPSEQLAERLCCSSASVTPLTCPASVDTPRDRQARSGQLHGVSITLPSVCLSCSLMQGKLSQPPPLCMFSSIISNFKTIPKLVCQYLSVSDALKQRI